MKLATQLKLYVQQAQEKKDKRKAEEGRRNYRRAERMANEIVKKITSGKWKQIVKDRAAKGETEYHFSFDTDIVSYTRRDKLEKYFKDH